MRIVVFGLAISSAWGNGHAGPWRALLAGLAERGHEVVFFERDQDYYAARRDCHRLSYVSLRLYRDWSGIRAEALREAAASAVAITTSYCPRGAAIQRELFGLKGPRQVFYDLDTPVTLDGLESGDARVADYLAADHIPRFDLYLSFSAGPALAHLRRRWGARAVAPLFLCANPRLHGRARPRPRYRAALSCMATYAADRQQRLAQLLTEPARRLARERFTLAGPMYPRGWEWPANLARFEHLSPGEHGAFFQSSAFTLNLTRAAMLRWGHAPQGRIFEAACCGTPVMSDRWPGLEDYFEPGRELLVVEDEDAVCRGLRDFSSHRREQMAWRARRRVLQQHGARKRARDLEVLLRVL